MKYLIRFGEIFLKGKNRVMFEKRLINNISAYLKNNNIVGKLNRKKNRFVLNVETKPDLRKVFGIVSYSLCITCKADKDEIKKIISEKIKYFTPETKFRITSKLVDKSLEGKKLDLNREFGSFVVEKTNAKVDLEHFDVEICIDVFNDEAHIFIDSIACFGGLPVGVEGIVLCLIEDEKSLLAALMAMRRGCKIICLMKKNIDLSLLEDYAHGFKLKQEKIISLSEVSDLAKKYRTPGIFVGQTLDDFEDLKLDIPVFRPLIAYSKEDIENKLEEFRK